MAREQSVGYCCCGKVGQPSISLSAAADADAVGFTFACHFITQIKRSSKEAINSPGTATVLRSQSQSQADSLRQYQKKKKKKK